MSMETPSLSQDYDNPDDFPDWALDDILDGYTPTIIEALRSFRKYIHHEVPAMYRPDTYDIVLGAAIEKLEDTIR